MDYRLVDIELLDRLRTTLGDPENWETIYQDHLTYVGPEATQPWEIIRELFICLRELE